MELGTLPPSARLTWLVGPPGAGKSTFARTKHGFSRTVELTEMLGPLINPVRMRKGVLSAQGRLVHLIRCLERHPDNQGLAPLLVVAGLIPEEVVFPLSEDEVVWLLRPGRERWERQLRLRPVGGGTSGQYDDYAYSELWYDRFTSWKTRERVYPLEIPFQPELLAKVVCADPKPAG